MSETPVEPPPSPQPAQPTRAGLIGLLLTNFWWWAVPMLLVIGATLVLILIARTDNPPTLYTEF